MSPYNTVYIISVSTLHQRIFEIGILVTFPISVIKYMRETSKGRKDWFLAQRFSPFLWGRHNSFHVLECDRCLLYLDGA